MTVLTTKFTYDNMASPSPQTTRAPAASRSVKVSVVIPARNEAANLPHVLAQLTMVDEVIVVDGSSTDGTKDVAKLHCPTALVIEQTGTGKGNALACGFRAAHGDVVVMIDADMSMAPTEIPRLVKALTRAPHTYVKGSRLMAQGGSEDFTRTRRIGNRALVGIVNLLYRTCFTDLCYGFIGFWRTDLDLLGFGRDAEATAKAARHLRSMGFEVETLLNVRAVRAGLDVIEVPSFERSRLYGQSNLKVIRDGLRVLRTIAVERLRTPRCRPVDTRSEIPIPTFDGSAMNAWFASLGDLDGRPDVHTVTA